MLRAGRYMFAMHSADTGDLLSDLHDSLRLNLSICENRCGPYLKPSFADERMGSALRAEADSVDDSLA
jgi:hypothetical protein